MSNNGSLPTATDAEIETVARRICVELGIDPDKRVGHGFGDTMTPAEWTGYCGGESVVTVPAILIYSPQWCLHRKTAAVAIAAKRATEALS